MTTIYMYKELIYCRENIEEQRNERRRKNTYSNSYHTTAGIHQIQTTNALYIVMYKIK